MSQALSLKEIAVDLLGVVADRFNARFASIWNIDPTTQHLYCAHAWYGVNERLDSIKLAMMATTLDHTNYFRNILHSIDSNPRLLNFNDVTNCPIIFSLKNHNLQYAIALPLINQENIYSILTINFSDKTFIDEDTEILLRVISDKITNFIVWEKQQANVLRLTRYQAVLSGVNSLLVRARDLEELFYGACEIAVNMGRFTCAAIGAVDSDGVNMSIIACNSKTAQDSHNWSRFGLLNPPTILQKDFAKAILTWKPVLRDHFPRDEQVETLLDPIKNGFNSWIVLPLIVKERVIGVFILCVDERAFFNSEEMRLAEELAGEIAFGVSSLTDREARDRLAAIVETSHDAIIANTLNGVITAWNKGATETYGYTAEEAIGRSIELIIPADKAGEDNRIRALIARGDQIDALETERVKKNGETLTVALTVSPTFDLKGAINGVSVISRDITDKKRVEKELIKAARFDGLTGLLNRGSFVAALDKAIERANRRGGQFALLFMDLDHFKDVNDTLGHPIGDRLLEGLAKRFRRAVSDTDHVARLGGDEFAVIAENTCGAHGAIALAQRLLSAASQPFSIDGYEIRSGITVGITLYEGGQASVESLLSQADIALYRAKSERRGTISLFNEAMDAAARERAFLNAELRTAINTGDQLFLLYQPQIDSSTGRIIGIEALVRWRNKRRGVVGPAEFVPLAEKLGISDLLDGWVLNEACRQVRVWLDAGLKPPRVGVNLSAINFRNPGQLEARLEQALAGYRLEPSAFELELTEGVLIDFSAKSEGFLARLRERGFMLSIDDFGTGYSSLSYLRRFRVDRIKIDQTFVADLGRDAENAVIVRSTIGLANDLGLRVIAEGVETDLQRDLLLSWGCPEMQGHLFATALPAEDLALLLRQGTVDAGS